MVMTNAAIGIIRKNTKIAKRLLYAWLFVVA